MVVSHNLQDLFDASARSPTLNLPIFKQNTLTIEYENSDDHGIVNDGQQPPLPFAQSGVYNASIATWRRLTAVGEDCKSVYEITLHVTGNNLQFKPGDTIGVIPHNTTEDVDQVINHLGLRELANVPYKLSAINGQKAKVPAHIPVSSTLTHVLTHCVDFRSALKKLFILALSRYTKDDNERRVLEYLCSKEGSNTYTTHILNNNLCILDIFTNFKSCRPPVDVILANLPRLLPRPYSIVNSSLKGRNTIRICFSVMEIGNNRKGLTTGWLEEMIINNASLENKLKNLAISHNSNICDKVPVYIRKNIFGFNMPDNLEIPLILIGPGTGIAPFIGFLEERELKKKELNTQLGDVWLFFGCRNPDLDFIYKEELNKFMKNGTLNKLCLAFSRANDNDIKYVQNSLLYHGKDVVKLIDNGAVIFVCGDLKIMAEQVKEALEKCLVKYSQRSEEEAIKFICDMQKEKRYIVDIWS